MLPFLTLKNINVAYSGKKALSGLSLEVKEGEHWAIVGNSGSGKTTLLEVIAGKHPLGQGVIRHHYYQRFIRSHKVKDPLFNYRNLVAEVSLQHHFKDRRNLSEFYYQQRFNSTDADEAVSVRDYLAGLGEEAAALTPGDFRKLVRDLHLEELLDKSLIKLSNGETRRLMFAAALVKRPQLLLLDAPFTGLDKAARPYFEKLINKLTASGITVIMSTSENEIPKGITHVARLENGRLEGTWKREKFETLRKDALVNGADGATFLNESGLKALEDLLGVPAQTASFEYAVQMRAVSVSYGDSVILQQVSWEVKRGARWALSGHNGAGKSTLLSLINADNPQAYANDITLFARKRGTGESIWEIKQKIGYVSPEMHQYFKTADTCLEVVLSGFFDTLGLIRKCTPEQEEKAARWLKVLDIGAFAGNLFRRCPLSVQRLTLLARALVKNPPLLILDEPCQGMDPQQVQRIRLLIDSICRIAGTTLIYVSHYTGEIPSCVDHLLKLEHGKVVYCGEFSPLSGTPAP